MLIYKIKNAVKKNIYTYRYDLFSLIVMTLIIIFILSPIFRPGQIVFSDMAFGFSSNRYIEEIFGIWNERWSTSTLLNVARLAYILPLYLLSMLLNNSGSVLLKGFIFTLILNSALSMYLFTKRIISVYYSKEFNFFKILALITGALFYALNPWVIIRIQHIYLLCGYCFFPFVLMFFFNAFDPKFQTQLIRNYNMFNKGIYKRNVLDLFLLALIFTISAAAIHYFFYGVIFLLILGLLVMGKNVIVNLKGNRKLVKNFVINFFYKVGLFGVFFSLLSAYWLTAYVGSIVMKAQVSQHNINVVDTLSLFSHNCSIKNVLYMISYWWPMFNINNLPLSFYVGGGVLIGFILYAVVMKSYKYSIIAFFTIMSIIFLIVSTGVKLSFFSSIFVIIVTKTPIIGSIFRDPNKIVGLMAVGFSVILTFGIQSFFIKLKDNLFHKIVKLLTISCIIVSFWFYIKPFYDHFINGFYVPVPVPQEYTDIQNNFKDKDKFDSKVLYFPIADNMIQSYTGVSTPFWNKNNDTNGVLKATGDVQVYSSQKNTIFQHEGNAPSITYLYNFLQYLLDKGLSSNIGKLVSVFGVNQFVYHNQYLGQETRQDFNEKILENQKDLKKVYENNIFKLYDVVKNIPYLSNVGKKIYTPYGLSRLESYCNMPNFNFSDFGVLFSTLDEKSSLNIDKANKGDYIEVANYNDLFLSNLPEECYLLPFEAINDGNAFLKWSKTLTTNNDWLWFLSSQDINNYPFDFDFGAGVGVTFATSKLDVPPYKMDNIKGNLVIDFDSMLKMEKFFTPDNPQICSVLANPKTTNNNIPNIYGQIIKGDPKNIWQVAKSGILEAKPNNPYRFNISISGRGVNKMHVKVRFYDKDMNELGQSYVVAPAEEIDFDSIIFTGDYVSPADTKYMRMDLLSFQRPEQKNYWWIHDIQLLDFEDYKKSNIFTMEKTFQENTKAKVYMRTFVSKKGGKLAIKIDDEEINVNTKNSNISSFQWFELGEYEFKKGINNISVENKEGFNAPNIFAIIPDNQYEDISYKIKTAVDKCNVFSVFEAESDFTYSSNIQSDRVYPKLSMGKGISSQNGELTRNIDIIKTDKYSFSFNINAINKNGGKLQFSITNKDTGEEFTKDINSSKFAKNGEADNIAIDKDLYKDSFPQVFKRLSNVMNYYKRIDIRDVFLKKGSYNIKIKFDSKVPSKINYRDLHKFAPNEINSSEFIQDIFEDNEEYKSCAKITPYMMNGKIQGDIFHIDYNKTCSNEWYDYASKKVLVKPDEEYLFQADVLSVNVRKRHMKILFLDENNKIIDVNYINDVEEKYKNQWNSYEQIIKVPENAKYMQFHILCRGNMESSGYCEIKNYSLIPYSEMLLLDNVIMYEGNNLDTFFQKSETMTKVTYRRIDTMKRVFNIDNKDRKRLLINFVESPNPLWEMSIGSFKSRGTMILNGVTTGFITDDTGSGKMEIILRKTYYFSFIFVALGFIIFIIIYKNINKINKILKIKNKTHKTLR